MTELEEDCKQNPNLLKCRIWQEEKEKRRKAINKSLEEVVKGLADSESENKG